MNSYTKDNVSNIQNVELMAQLLAESSTPLCYEAILDKIEKLNGCPLSNKDRRETMATLEAGQRLGYLQLQGEHYIVKSLTPLSDRSSQARGRPVSRRDSQHRGPAPTRSRSPIRRNPIPSNTIDTETDSRKDFLKSQCKTM
ncbi:uncharacterized protein LOC6598267 [Drosophila persimilis]|uniref:uncharacterized protein LOC6598267 n=1 Tax=Drosophila persimilis TaxID=7234 RepID=UPI000F077A0B|nr:uncharacterized protein LOC6598267 [Drosophila persimilis]